MTSIGVLLILVLYIGVPVLAFVVLYWVIRRAVAAGIADARRSESLPVSGERAH